jgi:outer membrane biogenesis lipoprotein LolB
MKPQLRFLPLVAALILLAGCAATPTDRAAKVLASTVQTVDVAMQAYSAAVVLDLVSPADQDQVRRLYSDYQGAQTVFEAALLAALKNGPAGELAAAQAALTAARDPLLQFLARFKPSPP